MNTLINSINAVITDVSVLDASVSSSPKPEDARHLASASLTCDKPEIRVSDGLVSVAAVTGLDVSASLDDGGDPFFSCGISVGCTVACPEGQGGKEIDELAKKLREYAVSVSIGYAREIIRSECLRSSAKTDLIIPPFDVADVLTALDTADEEQ